ncbi:DNA repair protein RecN, partial [Candidatus Dependentiae bacterium]|nr:DNA repair protein RecN [Candidatus Dependentiae bacterium]
MLQHLTIRQFALIDHYDIDFGKGLTVLTGETGAGKSILIDALSLALGGRAEAKSIREGATQAEVIAAFDISALPHVQAWLEERALNNEELCLLRRLVQPEGKSRAFINGTPVTVTELNALGSLLVDLHGQHEHHFLLKREHQLKLLDTFGQHQPLLEKLSHLVSSWQQLQKEKERYAALQGNASQAEFLTFQL